MTLDISLREFIEEKLGALDKKLEAFMAHSKDKFASQNEFRGALSDQALGLLPRTEYDVNHKALEDKVDLCQGHITTIELTLSTLRASIAARKEGIGNVGAVVLGVVSTIAMMASLGSVLVAIFRTFSVH